MGGPRLELEDAIGTWNPVAGAPLKKGRVIGYQHIARALVSFVSFFINSFFSINSINIIRAVMVAYALAAHTW